jgi:hypothetical protein
MIFLKNRVSKSATAMNEDHQSELANEQGVR